MDVNKRLDKLEAAVDNQELGGVVLVVSTDPAGTWLDHTGQPMPEDQAEKIRAKAAQVHGPVITIPRVTR
jgi:hypothetical protein